MVVTKGGLVFHAGGDGKFRAYDEDTGKVLWTGRSPATPPACPCRTNHGAGSTRDDRETRRWCRARHRREPGERHDRVRPEAAVRAAPHSSKGPALIGHKDVGASSLSVAARPRMSGPRHREDGGWRHSRRIGDSV